MFLRLVPPTPAYSRAPMQEIPLGTPLAFCLACRVFMTRLPIILAGVVCWITCPWCLSTRSRPIPKVKSKAFTAAEPG